MLRAGICALRSGGFDGNKADRRLRHSIKFYWLILSERARAEHFLLRPEPHSAPGMRRSVTTTATSLFST